jgi:MFS family permease
VVRGTPQGADDDGVIAVRAAGPGIGFLLVATLALSASHSAVFPLLADLQDEHDLSTQGLGIIAAAAFAGNLASQLGLARQADRGRARHLLVAGPVLTAVALAGFAISTELWQFVLARTLSGVGVGCFLPAVRALMAAHDPMRVGANLGRLASVELTGFVTGPVLSAGIAEVAGLQAPFVVLAAAAALTVPFVARMHVQGLTPVGAVVRGPGPWQLVRLRGVLVALLLGLALFFPAGVYEAVWARYLEDLGASTLFVGVTLTLYGLPFAVVAPLGGRIADRLGPVRTGVIGLLLALPLIVTYGIVDSPRVLVTIAIVEAVCNAAAVPAAQTAMARACPPEALATGQGLSGAIGLAGAGVAALGAGRIYDDWGSEWLFAGVAGVMLLLALAAVALARGRPVDAPPAAAAPLAVTPGPGRAAQ